MVSSRSTRSRVSLQIKVRPAFAHQGAGQDAGFGEDLEAIADAENAHALFCLFQKVGHNGRAGGNGAGPQIVTIGKSAGQK